MTSIAVPLSAPPSEEAARAAQEPLAAPVRLAWPQPRPSARLRLAALLAALAAHAAVLLALTRAPLDLRAGGQGRLMASVNIAMIDSTVLEARKAPAEQPPTPASKEKVHAKDGVSHGKQVSQSVEDKEQPEKRAPQVQRPDTEPAPVPAIDEPQRMPEQKRAKASNAERFGGFTSRADTATAADQVAQAAASPGVVHAYASAVAEALERTKLKRVPAYGTIRVKLVVSTDGGLSSVEILKSSGNHRLDDAVLAEVRRAKLPVPPHGLSLKERWFEFTYEYVR